MNYIFVCRNCRNNDIIFRNGYVPSEFHCIECGQKYTYEDIKDDMNFLFELHRKDCRHEQLRND